ncbi:hypothetical protein PchlR47_27645 [Pseudomonas chlororaphis]|nr:hypothetical protein PchlR47_27645 [Pseudomonas chlororaphis]
MQHSDQSNPFALGSRLGGSLWVNQVTRALNKNKKPETNNKNRARKHFWGSFGSPCGFRDYGFTHAKPRQPAVQNAAHDSPQLPTPSPD